MLDVEDLRTFIEVVDAGGLTPAAHRLGLSKSIVSRRLARLESELGAQLLVRTTRGIGLTEAGATFREHAGRVTAEIDAAREAISPEGDVRPIADFGTAVVRRNPTRAGLGQTREPPSEASRPCCL
jgi:DNA-binding transcriptional LysR family regulator